MIYPQSKLTESRILKTIMSENRLLVICYSAAFKGVTGGQLVVTATRGCGPSVVTIHYQCNGNGLCNILYLTFLLSARNNSPPQSRLQM